MSSQSTSDGNLMTLNVTFKLGTDLDAAQVLVQNRVAIAMPTLPQEVQRGGVTTKKQSPDITMVVHLFRPTARSIPSSRATTRCSRSATNSRGSPGVGDINVFGAREYSMRIWLDPEKIAARGLTAQDVVQAIREQNVQVAAGIVGAQPVPKGATAFQYTVSTQGRLADEAEFGNIVDQDRRRRPRHPRARRGPRRTRRARLHRQQPAQRQAGDGASASSSAPARTRSPPPTPCARRWRS